MNPRVIEREKVFDVHEFGNHNKMPVLALEHPVCIKGEMDGVNGLPPMYEAMRLCSFVREHADQNGTCKSPAQGIDFVWTNVQPVEFSYNNKATEIFLDEHQRQLKYHGKLHRLPIHHKEYSVGDD